MVGWTSRLVERAARRLMLGVPAPHRDWMGAALAELDAVPPGRHRLGWALGVLRFALGRRLAVRRRPSAADRGRRGFVALGALTVAPWLLVSVQGLRDDAPDGTYRSMTVLLAAQLALLAAFVAA